MSTPPTDPDDPPAGDEEPADNTPTISCSRCDRTWRLDFELDALYAGNQAFEQFALDHERHTGHFPDGVTPWVVDCQQCPDGERFLDERPARRWAETHARHTRHTVDLDNPETDVVIEPDGDAVDPAATAEADDEE